MIIIITNKNNTSRMERDRSRHICRISSCWDSRGCTSRSEQGSSKQNIEVQHTCHDTSFHSNLRGNRRTLEPWIIRIYLWTRQENLSNYTRTIGNTISFPKAVHIAAERKRTSIQKHVLSRVIFVPGSVPFQTTPNLQFLVYRPRACGRKNSIEHLKSITDITHFLYSSFHHFRDVSISKSWPWKFRSKSWSSIVMLPFDAEYYHL